MFEIISSSIEKVVELLGTFGYPGIFFLSLLDRLTVFLVPAEIVLPAFGILISRGQFPFWPVFVWLTVGNFLGNLALYFVFLKGGRPFLEKYGRYFLVFEHELAHIDHWFLKYGNKIVLFGYLIPSAVRSMVPIPAGISRMNVAQFSFFTIIGSMPLNLLYLLVGIKAGDNLDTILRYFEKFNYIVMAVMVILVLWYVYRHTIGKHLTHR